jgi:putative acetyltransferase
MNINIQNENPQHHQAVNDILLACFQQEAESKLVAALRDNGKVILSLVPLQDDEVVGHVMFTPVTTSPSSETKGLGLAPLAVKPEFQKQGIGSQLVRVGLRACTEFGYDYVVLLGNPKYYHRFGLQNEYGVDDEFMALELVKDCLRRARMLVKYEIKFSFLNV